MARCLRCARDFATGELACHTCGLAFPPRRTGEATTTKSKARLPVLPSKYEIVGFLGKGAMGRVYHCRDKRLQVDVAVKVLPSDVADDEEAIAQLTREAQAAAQLRDCQGILTLLSFDSHEDTWFLEMEYAAGGSLRDWLKAAGPLPEAEVRRIGAEVATALGFAHDRSVLHRDIKPDNVLVDARGRTRVSDFGIAKVRSLLSIQGTIPTLAGTPPYIAPEIFQRRTPDGRADLYSLGCMLYELATGSLPHGGTIEEILIAKALPGPPPVTPRSLNPALGEEFSQVILRMIEKDPDRRFADGAACAAALTSLKAPAASTPAPPESGSLGPVSVSDLVRYFLETRRDGTAEIRVDQATGTLFFVGGQCVNAVLALPLGRRTVEKKGEEAFFDILALSSGAYRLGMGRRSTVLGISRSTEVLLQEASAAPGPAAAVDETLLAPRTKMEVECPVCHAPTSVSLDAIDPRAGTFRCEICGTVSPFAADEAGRDSLVGEVVSDCRILERIGDDLFMVTYKAMDQRLRRLVAVKILKEQKDEKFLARFIAEAIAAAQVNHPNIVPTHKLGKDDKRNLHYLIVAYVEGRSLEAVVRADGPMEPWAAARVGMQIADALVAAHAKNVLHRDLHPGNVLLDANGLAQVVEFGLCKAFASEEQRPKVVGTPQYMAPELFEGKRPDVRVDVYSLGVTLYYLLSGALPFAGATVPQMIVAIMKAPARPLPEVRPDVPRDLWEIVRRMIAPKVEDRIPDAATVKAELEGWLRTRKPEPARTLAAALVHCAGCKREWPAGTRFCSVCGAKL